MKKFMKVVASVKSVMIVNVVCVYVYPYHLNNLKVQYMH